MNLISLITENVIFEYLSLLVQTCSAFDVLQVYTGIAIGRIVFAVRVRVYFCVNPSIRPNETGDVAGAIYFPFIQLPRLQFSFTIRHKTQLLRSTDKNELF